MNTTNNELMEKALEYLNLGFSIIPVNDKICLLKSWKEFQNRKPTKDEIEKWFFELNPTGIAIITGKISGVVVLDTENGADLSKLDIPRTPTVKTGGGGFHYYFKAPSAEIATRIRMLPKVDFKGDGGYVICPPSKHKSGNRYEWLTKFDEAELAEIPGWLVQKINNQDSQPKDWQNIAIGVSEGERHNSAVSLIGKLFYHIPTNDWKTLAWPLIQSWNENNDPPLPHDELRQIATSIGQKELASREQKNSAENYQKGEINIVNTANKEFNPVSLKELASREIEESRWTIKQLIPEASITMLSAPPATAKTWLSLHFAIQVSQGKMVLDKFQTRKQKVLFIEEDSNDRLIIRRLKLLNPNKEAEVNFLIRSGIKFENEQEMKILLELVKKEDIGLLIFDTLSQFHFQDENSNKDMVKIFAPLKKLTDEGRSVLLLHHHRKEGKSSPEEQNNVWKDYSQSARGASAITGMLNSHLIVQRLSKNRYVLRQTKLWEDEEMNPVEFEIAKECGNTAVKYLGTKEAEKDKMTLIEEMILQKLEDDNATREFLIDKLKDVANQSYVASAIAKLKRAGTIMVIDKVGPNNKTELYALPGRKGSENYSKDLNKILDNENYI